MVPTDAGTARAVADLMIRKCAYDDRKFCMDEFGKLSLLLHTLFNKYVYAVILFSSRRGRGNQFAASSPV